MRSSDPLFLLGDGLEELPPLGLKLSGGLVIGLGFRKLIQLREGQAGLQGLLGHWQGL